MSKLLATTAIVLLALDTIAMAQKVRGVFVSACQERPLPKCSYIAAERPLDGRFGISGEIIEIAPGEYLNRHLTVEVRQASVANAPHRIQIDFHQCMEQKVKVGDYVNLYIWQRPSPNTGAYTPAPRAK
jgi:hypothetical protein